MIASDALTSCESTLSLEQIRLSDAVEAVYQADTYLPHGSITDFWACVDEEVLLAGPAGTGKSRGVLEWIHFLLNRYPGARVLVCRKTRASLNESGLFTYEEQVLGPGHPISQGPSRQNRLKYVYPNGSEFVTGGLDKATRLFSTEYDLIYVQEAPELSQDEWESLLRALRNGVVPYQQLVGDCNPDKPTHHLKKRADSGGLTMINSRHADNPRLWDEKAGEWTPYGKAYIGKLNRLTGARYKRLRLGQWAGSEGMVFEAWDDAVHLVDRFDVPKEWRRMMAIDFGYTNPFVCQWWAQDPDGKLYLYREIYHTKRLVRDHARQINKLSEGESIEFVVTDHDAEDRATLEAEGIPTDAADKSVALGLEAVNARMMTHDKEGAPIDGNPSLFIMRDSLMERDVELEEAGRPCCTAEEIPGYVYPPDAPNRSVKEAPVKVDDHGCDAMRYLVMQVDQNAIDWVIM